MTPRRVPARLSRAYQRRLMRRGRLTYAAATLARLAGARRAVLGDAAPVAPRVLLRVGPFPGEADGAALLELARGLPFLLAVDAARALTGDEIALLAELRRAGVAFALNGPADALAARSGEALDAALDAAEARLAEEAAIRTEVLVAERFAFRHWSRLAARYSIVAGGPASLADMGYHDTPLWRGDAVWLPAYPPFHGAGGDVAAAVRGLGDAAGTWLPVATAADEAALGLAPWAAHWDAFADAVRHSRH